jgi:RNase adaptor protein for sRNA GlmZ degradation
MNLDQLEQEAENLKSIDTSKLSVDQLQQMVNKLTLMMERSESLLSEIKIEDIKINKDETDNS